MPTSPGKRRAASIAASRSRAAKWKRVRFKDNRLPETTTSTINAGGCWCGEPHNHDWPGRDKGEPHPVTSGKGTIRVPPHVVRREAILALEAAGVCPTCRGYPEEGLNGKPTCVTCSGTGDFPPPRPGRREQKLQKMVDKDADMPEAGMLWVPETTEGETMSETQNEIEEKKATDLASALVDLPDNFVVCRDMRHSWEIDRDFHVLSTTTSGVHEISRVLKCARCETRRQERYVAKNGIGLDKVRQSYQYAEGYQIPGVPRGAKPSAIVQQEQYRRAMERQALLARKTSSLPPT